MWFFAFKVYARKFIKLWFDIRLRPLFIFFTHTLLIALKLIRFPSYWQRTLLFFLLLFLWINLTIAFIFRYSFSCSINRKTFWPFFWLFLMIILFSLDIYLVYSINLVCYWNLLICLYVLRYYNCVHIFIHYHAILIIVSCYYYILLGIFWKHLTTHTSSLTSLYQYFRLTHASIVLSLWTSQI